MELTREEVIDFVAACEGIEALNDLLSNFCGTNLEDTHGKTADIAKVVSILINHAKEHRGIPSDPENRGKCDEEVSDIIYTIWNDDIGTEEKAKIQLR